MFLNLNAFTLVDITDTGSIRIRDNNTKEYHQQQNLNVLLQTISLRAQPFEPKVKIFDNAKLNQFDFGKCYRKLGSARVWQLSFYTEQDMVWSDGEDQLAFLKSDSDQVAITTNLDETVDFDVDVFDTLMNRNLYFEIIK